ncbi:TetR/AcrR family transcriptional regulator [Aerococcus urinae]|uniref:TetR family transcriptional regulator n=1 Tax=Aerococcus urinae TaxID=1376 RepID=A0A0X8FF16_9LACT|nr:TetR/AcrR family transcriptional regulator [Aerococcus urinae]AMB96087.1 hypothetical protein AWM73_06010 [Aerococcus urinae]MCY3033330.1 TetR/AcrR family transcriptional regulator [Aerococcus urinae]MCY3038522.1 TetR/AcrR family transcriptional regulator [Aerococcus urinae]MCY3045296.1 TetR/AcrR family transcriptional regulator [Aerococcus urinae]MCY3047028.1 TetR/AcrR family transcriptional regulator [Aerococcus urinae]
MNTKIIIFLALEKLLKSKPFEKITVIEIAQAAHISRATFYRHFEDKFDLANWYYRQKAEEVFQDTSQDSPWYIFYGLSLFMGQEDATFMQVMLNERGQNSFFDFVSDIFYDYWLSRYQKNIHRPSNAKERFALAIWSRGGASVWQYRLNTQKRLEAKEMADLFEFSMPDFLKASEKTSSD